MRLSIELVFNSGNKHTTIAMDYDPAILSLIKLGLSNVNLQLFEELYNKNTPKNFTFSLFFKENVSFKKEYIELGQSQKCILNFSINDGLKATHFYNSFIWLQQQSNLHFDGENVVEFGRIELVEEPIITTNEVCFKALSPIVVRQNQKIFLSYKEDNAELFNEILRINMKSRLRGQYSTEILQMVDKLEFEPVRVKKVVSRNFGLFVESTKGSFVLKGNPVLLNLINKIGLGVKCGSGFGMITN
ncbi:MAG: CRISPR-associated endoribonuclease Cas6 [Liquorilactobacillus sp.]|uniref:CRISPR-associated endoribonuclease Cas6 n=2 Tax=Liquorilactobacillus sp. TaxID=2767923 RepID=UPI0039EC17C5